MRGPLGHNCMSVALLDRGWFLLDPYMLKFIHRLTTGKWHKATWGVASSRTQ